MKSVCVAMTAGALAVFCCGGCRIETSSSTGSSNPPTPAASSEDGHHHHHHEEGPHGGHLVELGEEAYHAEWTHDEAAELITVYFLDSSGKNDVTEAVSDVSIVRTLAGNDEPITVALTPVDGAANAFMVKDEHLLVALDMVGGGVEATIHANIGGTEFTGQFEKHEHGHSH